MTSSILIAGAFVLLAIITVVALACYGPSPTLEEQRKREILDAHLEYKNRRGEREGSTLSPAVHERLRHSMIDYPDDEGKR